MEIEAGDSYNKVLAELKSRVRQAQYRALQTVNRELIALYWDMGRAIVEQQQQQGWGDGVIERLSRDLQLEFAGVAGFSVRNLRYMRLLYRTYGSNQKLQPLVAEIGWSHNLIILDRCHDDLEREYYMRLCREHGWSKGALAKKIKDRGYESAMLNQTNFAQTLPEERRIDALLAVKDDYNFSFLGMDEVATERELESALVANVTALLAEMGGYFTFAGRQFRLEVSNEEYFIDLLFFHRQLRCLVAVELKAGEFKPEYAGKMQFYLSALDEQARVEGENPSIGIIICRNKDRTKVEYTLRDVARPIGVASYNHYSSLEDLPERISRYLPSPEEIEGRLSQL